MYNFPIQNIVIKKTEFDKNSNSSKGLLPPIMTLAFI